MKIRILGLDPGSRITGYGLIEYDGQSVTYVTHGSLFLFRNHTGFTQRLSLLGNELKKLFELYQPQHVAIERVFLGRNADSAFKLGHARGVAVYEAALHGCQIHEYAAREVKKGVTGRGAAEKFEVMAVIHRLLRVPANEELAHSEDASDALALAFFHSQKMRQIKLMRNAIEI